MFHTPSSRVLAMPVAIFLAGAVLFALLQTEPPPPGPASLPADQFSSARAMAHLRRIAEEAHPTGSEADARVRRYLLDEFHKLGIPAEEQTSAVLMERRGVLVGAEVRNIVARLAGMVEGKAVLVMCHHDTVYGAPGAGDDGHAVAATLEAARALAAGPRLRNSVIFLITDGEEMGLAGVRAFIENHQWARDVAVVYNMDARGTGGAPYLFETSDGNGWLIEQFADAAPYPVGSSAGYEVYRRMPNGTDFTAFRNAGAAGLNTAFLEGEPFYHSPRDSVDHFEEGSLEQQGANLLAMAQRFGSLVLDDLDAPNAVFFSPLRSWMVHYPSSYALAFAGFDVGLLVALVLAALWNRRITFAKMVAGVGVFVGLVILASGLVWLVWSGVRALDPQYLSYGYGMEIYNAVWYRWAFVALVVAVFVAADAWLAPRLGVAALYSGTLLVLAVVQAVIAFLVPGASYVLTWPVLFSLAAFWFLARRTARPTQAPETPGPADSPPPAVDQLAAVLAASIGSILVMAPIVYMVWIAMGIGYSPLIVALVSILAGLLMPALSVLSDAGRGMLPWLAGAAFLALLAAGSLTSGFNAERPLQDSVFYALEAETGKAVFATSDKKVDEWTSQFLGASPGRKELPGFSYTPGAVYRVKDAPASELSPPDIQAEVAESDSDRQVIRLTLHSTRGADGAVVMPLESQTVFAARLETPGVSKPALFHAVSGGSPLRAIVFPSFPRGGVTLWLAIPPRPDLRLRMLDISDGLPQLPGFAWKPRPAWIMRRQSGVFPADAAIVGKDFEFHLASKLKDAGR